MAAPALLVAIPLLVGVAAGALGPVPGSVALAMLAVAWLASAVSLAAGCGRTLIASVFCGCLSAGGRARRTCGAGRRSSADPRLVSRRCTLASRPADRRLESRRLGD